MKKVTPELLLKYQQGTCNPAEKILVEDWLAKGDPGAEVYTEPEEIANLQEKKIWNHIAGNMQTGPARFFQHWKLWAAACFFILLSGGAWFMFNQSSASSKTVADVSLHQVHTANGQQKKLLLADKSMVQLNAGSELEYPQTFSINERRVKLVRGEAFFDIAKDSARPFQLDILHATVKVLGTRFNINLRGFHHQAIITLTEGKIAFTAADGGEYLLQPGQQIIYDTATRKVTHIVAADTAQAIAWTEGKLIFKNTPMEYALQQLELKYGTRFIIQNHQLNDIPLTASFSSESLEQVLHMIELASGIQFNKKDHVIQVSK